MSVLRTDGCIDYKYVKPAKSPAHVWSVPKDTSLPIRTCYKCESREASSSKQFLGFIEQIEKSPKKLPKELLQMVKFDMRSTTSYNLRRLMLLLNKRSIENLSKDYYRIIEYKKI